MALPQLRYTLPNGAEASLPISRRLTSIGSGEDNDVVLVDREVDATHAVLRFDGQRLVLQSMSRRGVQAGGQTVEQVELRPGQPVSLGRSRLWLAVEAEDRTPVAAAALQQTYARILELSRMLLSAGDLSQVLEKLMDAILALTQADKGFLLLGEPDHLEVRVARNVGPEAEGLQPWSDSIVRAALEGRKPVIVADALHDQEFAGSRSVVSLRVCSVMCVPLMVADQLIGLIYVGNDNVVNLFTESHLEALTILAAQAALIVSRTGTMDALRQDNERLQARLHDMRFGSLVGGCEAMQVLYRRVEKVAATDVSVLITGETGTGKELIAREVHNRSERARGPFVTINCGAIPENLLESELFGHARGAFTGAVTARGGKFQAADRGTLFLDEIGEMPMNLQVKILRALQERTVTRVGETRPEKVDIRIVAATHRDLQERIQQGLFREDLFYRLNVVRLHLPPLRDRGEDVVLIARFLLDRFGEEYGTPRRAFSRDALQAIRRYPWPGNIRQLENHLRKAVILAEGDQITAQDLDLDPDMPTVVRPLAEAREAWQRRYILEALAIHGGNRTRTARDLGVDPRTVFRFLEKESDRDGEES
jgi:transcriptional regulator with GAF, ATPase, and Fis domain